MGLCIDICDPITSYNIEAVSYTDAGAKNSASLRCVFVSLILTGSEQCQVTLLFGWRETGSISFYHTIVHMRYLAAIDPNIVQIAYPLGGELPVSCQVLPTSFLNMDCNSPPVCGEFPAQRPVTRSFDFFFDLHPNKRLSK